MRKQHLLRTTGCSRFERSRPGFTVLDLLAVIVIFVVVFFFLAAAASKSHRDESRFRCAANLRNIATHAFIYSNMDIRGGGKFPRTYYYAGADPDRSLTGNVAGTKSFDPANPAVAGVNNTQAAFYLLMKETDLTAEVFNCPYGEATRAYVGNDLANYANWPAPYAAFNSYSYACPYPTKPAVAGGWKLDNSLGPDYPLAADINPGDTPAGGPTTVSYTDSRKAMQRGNSPNHWFEGQYVAYCDVHVEWQTTPFAGVQRAGLPYRDNIYASTAGGVDAAGKGGTIWAQPQDPADAVMLPTAQDSPGTAIAARTPEVAPPPRREITWIRSPGDAATAGAIAVGLYLLVRLPFRRRRRRPEAPPPQADA